MELPYKKVNDTVALVGMAGTTRKLAPWNDPSIDIYSLNNAHDYPEFTRATAWFDIHQSWEITRSNSRYSLNHYNWLQEEHPFPIFVKEELPRKLFPSTVRYPLEEIIFKYGAYFTSTMPYMMAYAIEAGYSTIQIFGVEMAHDSEYAYQRPNMEYWIGVAKGLGIKVELPDACSLLRGDLYGFEDASIAHQTFYSFRYHELSNQVDENTKLAWEAQGKFKTMQDLFIDYRSTQPDDVTSWLGSKIQEADEAYSNITTKLEHIRGAMDEVNYMLKWSKEQNQPADRIHTEEKPDEQAPKTA